MKSVKGLSDIQDFFNWMWAVDPRLASRLNDWHDYYRRACKQVARRVTTYGDFSFTVDGRYRVDVKGIYTAEDFIGEYQRLLVLYRAAFQAATAGECDA
ncbi:hypothetical protein M2F17_001551 [Escherichia coli]|nr:hypothetical protein [Escherichia coli]